MKNLKSLKEVIVLTKNEQKSINGGGCVILCCPEVGCLCVPKGVACML